MKIQVRRVSGRIVELGRLPDRASEVHPKATGVGVEKGSKGCG